MHVKEMITVSAPYKSKSKDVTALFDTGAKFTYINISLGNEMGFTRFKEPVKVQLAVKGKEGKILGHTSLVFIVSGCEMPLRMQTYVVDLKEGRVKLKRYPPEVRLI